MSECLKGINEIQDPLNYFVFVNFSGPKMSGDLQRKQYHKQKYKNKGSNEILSAETSLSSLASVKRSKNSRLKHENPTTSLYVKLLFYMSLSALVLVATLTFTDYQNGQLREAYETHVPEQVWQLLKLRSHGCFVRKF